MEKLGPQKARLSEKIEQQNAEFLAVVGPLIEANVRKQLDGLTQLVSGELATTGAAIKQQNKQISALLQSQQSALAQQQATVDALKSLSLEDLESIRDGLTTSLNEAQGQAIEAALGPLTTSLGQLKTDGEALSRVTLRGWLKPVCIGLVICLGMGGLVWGAASLLQVEIDNKRQDLQALKQEISQAEQTLAGLPKGVRFVNQKDGKYIVAKWMGDPFIITEGELTGQKAVAIGVK